MRTPRGLGASYAELAYDARHTPESPVLDCDVRATTSEHVDDGRNGPHIAARPGARVPLHRADSLHAFLRGRELCRVVGNTTHRPVRDFVSGDTSECSDDDDDDADEAVEFGRRRVGTYGCRGGQSKPSVVSTRSAGSGVVPVAELAESEETDVPCFVCRFAPRGDSDGATHEKLLAVANETGDVVIVDVAKGLPGSVHAFRTHQHTATTQQQTTSSQQFTKHVWQAHANAVFDLRWCYGTQKMLTASGDQTVKLWDVETEVCHRTFRFHRGSVKAIAVRPGETNGAVFASAGRDGCVALWDTRVARRGGSGGTVRNGEPCDAPIAAVERAHEPARVVRGSGSLMYHRSGNAKGVSLQHLTAQLAEPRTTRAAARGDRGPDVGRGVTSVAFAHDGQILLTAGAADGVVKLWDVRKLGSGKTVAQMVDCDPGALAGGVDKNDADFFDNKNTGHNVATSTSRRRGITSLALAPGGSTVVAVSYSDSHIGVFNHASPCSGPVCHLRGVRDAPAAVSFKTSFYVKTSFSPQGTHLASGSCDGKVYVWRVDRPCESPVALQGHSGEVTAVDWCAHDFNSLVSCADDGVARVWAADRREAELSRRRREKTSRQEMRLGANETLMGANETLTTTSPAEYVFQSPTRFRDVSGPESNGHNCSPPAIRTPLFSREHAITSYFSPTGEPGSQVPG